MCLGVRGLREQGHLMSETSALIERRGAKHNPILPNPDEVLRCRRHAANLGRGIGCFKWLQQAQTAPLGNGHLRRRGEGGYRRTGLSCTMAARKERGRQTRRQFDENSTRWGARRGATAYLMAPLMRDKGRDKVPCRAPLSCVKGRNKVPCGAPCCTLQNTTSQESKQEPVGKCTGTCPPPAPLPCQPLAWWRLHAARSTYAPLCDLWGPCAIQKPPLSCYHSPRKPPPPPVGQHQRTAIIHAEEVRMGGWDVPWHHLACASSASLGAT